MWIRWP